MHEPKRPEKITAFAIFLAAVLIHSLLLFVFLPPAQLVKYTLAAAQDARGELTPERQLDFSPLYLQVHRVAYRISSQPARIVAIAQVILVGLSTVLLFFLLRRHLHLWIAIAGAVVFCLDTQVIVYTQTLEPEPFILFFSIAFAALVMRPGVLSHVTAGVVLGLLLLTRMNFLPLMFLTPVYLLMTQGSLLRRIGSSLAVILPPAICLLLLGWHNSPATGTFAPVVMNPGTVFYEGNHPDSRGHSAVYPQLLQEIALENPDQPDYQHEVYRMFARRITGKDLTVPEVNEYWSTMAIHYLRDYSYNSLRLFATKAFHFFHGYLWHDLANAFWNEQWLKERWFPSVPFSVISALAIWGLVLLVPRWRVFLPLYAILLSPLISTVLTYSSARQRSSVVWIFVFFACAAVDWIRTSPRRGVWCLPIVAILALALQLPTDLMTEETRMWLHIRKSSNALTESYRLRSADQLPDASRTAAIALALAPFHIDSRRPANLSFPSGGFALTAASMLQPKDLPSYFDKAVLLLEAGKAVEAEPLVTRVLDSGYKLKRDLYQSSEPLYYAAWSLVLQDRKMEAMDSLQKALLRSPADPSTLALLYALTKQEGYVQQLLRYSDAIDARFAIGKAALLANEPDLAITNLQYVTNVLPELRRGHFYLAAALGRAGRFAEGVSEYRAAMKLNGDPLMCEEDVIRLFQGFAKERARDDSAQHSYGIVLRQYGHYDEALKIQQKVATRSPSKAIQDEIQALQKVLSRKASNGLP